MASFLKRGKDGAIELTTQEPPRATVHAVELWQMMKYRFSTWDVVQRCPTSCPPWPHARKDGWSRNLHQTLSAPQAPPFYSQTALRAAPAPPCHSQTALRAAQASPCHSSTAPRAAQASPCHSQTALRAAQGCTGLGAGRTSQHRPQDCGKRADCGSERRD